MLSKVAATVEKYHLLETGDTVVVAVSGGPDSVALLACLRELQDQYRLTLHVAHLNHMFRGEEAEEDALFVEELASQWGIPSTVESYDVPALMRQEGLSPQDAARRARYAFLYKVAQKVGAGKIAVGHHADDQVETVLMHFLNGAGPAGLRGMLPRTNMIIRPFIQVRRAEIENYLREHQLAFRQDPSNLKNVYLRNKIRLDLVPYLEKEFNPNLIRAINQTADIIRAEDELMCRLTENTAAQIIGRHCTDYLSFDKKGWLAQPLAIQRRLVRYAYEQITTSSLGLSFAHVEQAVQLVQQGTVGKKLDLPGGVRLVIQYDLLLFTREEDTVSVPPFYYRLQVPGNTCVPELGLVIKASVLPVESRREQVLGERNIGDKEAFVNFDKIQPPLYVRRRKHGDRFQPLGMVGTKKLKDFFIDRKVPNQVRDRVPIVVSGDNIIWVAGYQIDDRYKVTPSTREVLHLKICDCYEE